MVPNISIILPAYNNENSIREVALSALSCLSKITEQYELIVVDDCSYDKTARIVDELSKKEDKLKPLYHSENLGKGNAIKSGILSSKYNFIFYTDCDGQYDVSEIEKLLPFIEHNDLIVGYRLKRKDGLTRKIVSKIYNLLNRLLFGVAVKDIGCAFKLFKRDAFDNLEVKTNGFFFDAELIIRAKKAGLSIKEVGISHYPSLASEKSLFGGKSSIRTSHVIKIIVEMVKLKLDLLKIKQTNIR